VVRGPQSGLYGADAIGGVINIITKKGRGRHNLAGSLEGGSFGNLNQNARISGSLERFKLLFGFLLIITRSNIQVTPPDLIPAGRLVQGDSYDNKTFSGRFGADLTDNFDLWLAIRYIGTSLNFTGDDFLGPEALKSNERDQQLFTRGTAHLVSLDRFVDQL